MKVIKTSFGKTTSYAVFPFGNATRIEVNAVEYQTPTVNTPGLGDISASSTVDLAIGMRVAASIAADLNHGRTPEKSTIVYRNNRGGVSDINYLNTNGEKI